MSNKQSTQKNKFSLKNFKINPIIKYIMLILIGIGFGLAVHFYWNKPNCGIFLGSDMDPAGSVYVLGVNSDNNQYKISKISPKGNLAYQINLENPSGRYKYYYSQLKVDFKGNFYVVQQSRDTEAVVVNETKYPISHEAILMYDTNGKYVKQVAKIDFSEDASPPTVAYMIKIQTINDEMRIVGRNKNNYDVITAKPLEETSPQKLFSFQIEPPVDQSNVEWVNDIAVLSNG